MELLSKVLQLKNSKHLSTSSFEQLQKYSTDAALVFTRVGKIPHCKNRVT